MNKKRIAVLFGGCSPEHSVSLHSAYSVLCALDKEKYRVIPIGITREGQWFHYYGDYQKIPNESWSLDVPNLRAVVIPQDRTMLGILEFTKTDGLESCTKVGLDAAFPVLHGRNGEDGTVQGLLELAGIPVVGCGVMASALCMDKDRAHKLAEAAGVRVPKSVLLHKNDTTALSVADTGLCLPIFVKPLRAGSSFGISKIYTESELLPAIRHALEYDDTVVLEENINGFEVGCAVLGNEELTVGRVDEIELTDGFFDYTEKYTLKNSQIHVPARIEHNDETRIQEAAKIIYRALGCRGFARVDLFFTPEKEIVFNEVNTIPGFTEHSRFPNMLEAVGLSFEQVVEKAIALAVDQ